MAHGLRRHKPWGRTLALVEACLIVLSFPIGTALGGYTLYVLLQSGAGEQYARVSQTAATGPYGSNYPGI